MNNRIKSIRTTLKLSQQHFAERIGITRGAIANIESGKKSPSNSPLMLSAMHLTSTKNGLLPEQAVCLPMI